MLHVWCEFFALFLQLVWHDSSLAEAPGYKDNIVNRVTTLQHCKLRSYNQKGFEDQTLLIALVGERRGRLVDKRDVQRLKAAGFITQKGRQEGSSAGMRNEGQRGCLDWVEDAFDDEDQGISLQEMEIRMAAKADFDLTEHQDASGSTLICMRNGRFVEDEMFLSEVPDDVQRLFRENDKKKRQRAEEFRRMLRANLKSNILEYHPCYDSFSYPWEEGVNTNARKVVYFVFLLQTHRHGWLHARPLICIKGQS